MGISSGAKRGTLLANLKRGLNGALQSSSFSTSRCSSTRWRIPSNNHHPVFFYGVLFYLLILILAVFCHTDMDVREREDFDENSSSGSSSSASEWNSLAIIPVSKNRVYQRALGKSSIFTCSANVEFPERLNDFRWWWPDGRAIEATDSSEGFYDETRVEIMKDQTASLTLLFPAIQEQDLGTYRCTAVYDNAQQLKTDFTLRAYVPITFEDAPVNQYAIKGHDYRVRCRVRSDPEPQVDWKKDHRVINDSDHFVIHKDGIVIRSVSEMDEGVYTCRVRVVEMGTVQERQITVAVHERPQLISRPERLEGVESEAVTLKCEATGKPACEYEWKNQKGENVKDLSWERYKTDKYKGTLQIIGITKEDAQTFTCIAKNPAGYVTMKSTLVVVTKPVIEEFKNLTTQVNFKTALSCRAFGEPAPDIRFLKDGNREPYPLGPQTDNRIFIEQMKEDNGTTIATLKITEAHRYDDGLYQCIAFNQRTKTVAWGHLQIQFPPSFLLTPMREAWSWNDRPVNLTTFVEAIPNATITWFDTNDVAVDQNTPNQKMKQIGKVSRSILKIFPGYSSMYGTYRVLAINKLGTAEHRIHLREARKPGPMLEAILHEKTAATLAYKLVGPVEDGGLPIKSFLAQIRKEGDSWVQHRLKTWPVDRQIFVIDGLQPMQTYHVRFAAENVVGLGNWELEKIEQTPKKSAPDSPVILNEVVGDFAITAYPDKFQLIWKLPPDNGEKIELFEISYEPVRNISVKRPGIVVPQIEWDTIGQKQVLDKVYPGQPRITLRNLAPDTFYRVQIRARNQIGSSAPDSIIFKTATVPGEAWRPLRSPVKSAATSCRLPSSQLIHFKHITTVISSHLLQLLPISCLSIITNFWWSVS